MKRKGKAIKNVCKTAVFLLLLVLLLAAAVRVLRPLFRDKYTRTPEFYAQPENTVEVLFTGSSVIYSGVSPIELYEDYGICSYNLATNSQPVLTSYYWLKEAYDLHGETLSVLIMDPTMLLRDDASETAYQKAIWGMRTSVNKFQAVQAITDNLEDFLSYMVPLITWHSRWSDMEEVTAEALLSDQGSFMRGYYYASRVLVESEGYAGVGVPAYVVDENAEPAEYFDEAILYFEKILAFCEEHDIELILVKTPCSDTVWSDDRHIAAENIAEEYGLTFIDLNYSPYLEELDFNAALDLTDDRHMNHDGAEKLTAWFGEYLTANCSVTDVRGDETYAFLEEELEEYNAFLEEQEGAEAVTETNSEDSDTADTAGIADTANTTDTVNDADSANTADAAGNSDSDTETDLANEADETEEIDEELAEQLALYALRCEDQQTLKTLHSERADLETYLAVLSENDNYDLWYLVKGTEALGETYADVLGQYGAEFITINAFAELYEAAWPAEDDDDEEEDVSAQDVVENGLNIVVYNRWTELIVDLAVFDADGELLQYME